MPRIVLPPSIWTRQPQFITGVDRSNKLGQKVVYSCPLGTDLYDRATGKIATNSGSTVVPTLNGLGRKFVPGSSQFVTLPTTDMVPGYPLTVAGWCDVLSTDATGYILYSLCGTTYKAILGCGYAAGKWVINASSAQSTNGCVANTGRQRILCVHRSTSFDLYIDGVLQSQSNISTAWGEPAAGNHSIGSRLNGSSPRYWSGSIADMVVFGGELSSAEIAEYFRNPFQIYAPIQRPVTIQVAGGGSSFNDSVTESVTSSESSSCSVVFSAAIAESSTATESETSNAVLSASLNESATAGESSSASGGSIAASINESATPTDLWTDTASFSVSTAESASASDTQSASVNGNSWSVSIVESASSSDAWANIAALLSVVVEAASAIDSPGAGLNLISLAVEAAFAGDAWATVDIVPVVIPAAPNYAVIIKREPGVLLFRRGEVEPSWRPTQKKAAASWEKAKAKFTPQGGLA